MKKNDTTEQHKPTCNGIFKGRPGAGKVLSLGERKTCYAGHKMTPENTFKYRAKLANGKRAAARLWCRKCRTASRKRSVEKRLELARAEAKAKEQKNAKARARRTAKRSEVAA